jgi:hypothetical protein
MGTVEQGELKVSAIVQSQSEITELRLLYCFKKGARFNDAKDRYKSLPMKRVGDGGYWKAALPSDREVYWFVEARDRAQGFESIATTLLKRTQIYRRPSPQTRRQDR